VPFPPNQFREREAGKMPAPRNASAVGSDTRFDCQRIGFAASKYGIKLGSVAGDPADGSARSARINSCPATVYESEFFALSWLGLEKNVFLAKRDPLFKKPSAVFA
jgi:hypothetical protein